jgi:hypothetical protein
VWNKRQLVCFYQIYGTGKNILLLKTINEKHHSFKKDVFNWKKIKINFGLNLGSSPNKTKLNQSKKSF